MSKIIFSVSHFRCFISADHKPPYNCLKGSILAQTVSGFFAFFLDSIVNKKQNKIAQGEINIFSHSYIYARLRPFFENCPTKPEVTSYIEKILSDLSSACSNQSKTTPHLPISDNFGFGGNFGQKTRKIVRAVLNKTMSYRPILLIFNSKHGVPLGYIVSKFEENRTKITPVRVPHRKSTK